jgi:hypothetical protein
MVPEKDSLQEEAVYFEVFTTNLILFTFIVSSTLYTPSQKPETE